jgi:UDP-N-acetylmuramyl-tripeptide synthetase
MEVTAHGLDQYRVWGCNFYVGVLTNITHEHLDDFVNMKRYTAVKMRLFRGVKYAVLNEDDASFDYFKFKIQNSNIKSNSKFKTQIISYKKSKLKQVSPALIGEYNLYNIGAAETTAKILDVRYQILEDVIKNFKGVAGRREEIKAGQKFKIFVDFAHTPNALEQVLRSLRIKEGKLIVVFGCTGERDKEKRPMMGEIAARLADVVIITSDDTRGEDQDEIARQIIQGVAAKQRYKVTKQNDRRDAIRTAIKIAEPGDTVLLAGKGHEKSILIGKNEQEWSDADVVKEEIGRVLRKQK